MTVVTYLWRECPYLQLSLPLRVKRRQLPHVFATQVSAPSSDFLPNFVALAGSLKQPSSCCSGMFTYSSISLHLAGPASFVVLNFPWSQIVLFFILLFFPPTKQECLASSNCSASVLEAIAADCSSWSQMLLFLGDRISEFCYNSV